MIKETTSPNIKPGYKKSPIGMIPEEWEMNKFGDFLEFKNGVNASKNDYGKGIKFINVLEVITNLSLKNEEIPGEVEITEKQFERYKVEKGDILFNRTSETQEEIALSSVYLDDYPTVFGGFVIRGRFIKNVYLNEFKKYIFRNLEVRKQIIPKGQGAVRVNIGQSDLEKISAPIPPLPEQEQIADCLTTWDKGIEKLSTLIEAKKQQKKGVMQRLLTEKKRLPGFTEEWKEVMLGQSFKERNERGFDDLDLLSIGEVGVYPQSSSNKKDTSNADKSKYKLIEEGDLGYNTMRLWQGRIALSGIRGIVSPAYTIITPQKEEVHSKFFSYFFRMPFVVHQFYRNSQGMVSDTLTCRYRDFKKIKLKVPSLEEQIAIAEILSTADQGINLLEKKLETMQLQKKGLMQVLLTGEKRLIENQ